MAIFRGRSRPVLAFAAYAIGAGSLNVAYVIDPISGRPEMMRAALTFGLLGYWGLFVYFPSRLNKARAVPAVVSALTALAMGLGFAVTTGQALPVGNSVLVVAVDLALQTLVSGGIIAVALILPIRAAWTNTNGSEARSLGILAVGIVVATAGTFPDIGRAARGDAPALVGILDAVYVLLPTLLWLGVTRRCHARVARTVIIASVTIYIASLGLGPAAAWAVGQAGAALLLGYAVLRGQIDGLDLKVRFALSRSTIAAAFIAVFFVASEGAQQYFGDTTGSQYLGIAAAGALVFAIAPLQRASERLAERAVPVVAPPGREAQDGPPEPETLFLNALHVALRDKRITRVEETHLYRLAAGLGIDAGRAHELFAQAEQEAADHIREVA